MTINNLMLKCEIILCMILDGLCGKFLVRHRRVCPLCIQTILRKNFDTYSYMKEALEDAEIIDDVTDTAPPEFLNVRFPTGYKVELGNRLTPLQTRGVPSVKWKANPEGFYTLVMVDPDCPNRQKPVTRECQHWIVCNIPGDKVNHGDVITNYYGPLPQKDSGFHRIVFLLYEQKKEIFYFGPRISNSSVEGRGMFSVERFAIKYNLGNPVAGNYFETEYDYSPLIYGPKKTAPATSPAPLPPS